MTIKLPKKIDGSAPIELQGARQITVIGANGSGKTRFCDQLVQSCGDKAYCVSALRAIFPVEDDGRKPLAGSIDERFNQLNASIRHVKSDARTEFDKLYYVMMHDEFLDLMNYKAHLLLDEEREFPKTKLDIVVKKWQQVFPRNKVLRENGKLMFSSEGNADHYSMMRLSDGEKAVLYYIGAVLYAMPGAAIFVDDPEVFLHHSITHILWNTIEAMRPDCTFIYNTHDVDFAATRVDNRCVWVKSFDAEAQAWDYEVMRSSDNLSDAIYIDLLGTRKPVLFIEGDSKHSIDSRLYPLIFPEYTCKPLGSCNRVIESVRAFNDLSSFHHLDSWGIVDRDRRDENEVAYLREKKILVPNVAEIENIMMLEGVIRAVARNRRKNENDVFFKVKQAVIKLFNSELKQQALMHVRHRVKRNVEMRIDMKFTNIGALENHLGGLVNEINPRAMYDGLCRQFHRYADDGDYDMVLRVFNEKAMLGNSGVAGLCGLSGKNDYISTVLNILKAGGRDADAIRTCIKNCFGLPSGVALSQATPPKRPTAPKPSLR